MSRFKNSYRGYYPANINVTKVTNITNVTNVTHVGMGHGGWHKYGHRHGGHSGLRRERPPKLTRFLGSCGLLDRDVAARMDSGELCCESAKVVGYAAKGIARDVRDVGSGLCGAAKCLFDGVCDTLGALFS